MPDFEKKSFGLTMTSPDADPADLEKRWKDTFGDRCPARHHTSVECSLKRGHEGLHDHMGVVTWEEK